MPTQPRYRHDKARTSSRTRCCHRDHQENRWSIPRYAQHARPQSGQKEGRIRLAWIWQARKAEKEGSHGLQSEDAAENQNSSQDRRQIPSRQGGKGRGSGAKEVDLVGSRIYLEKRLTTRPGRESP